MRDSPNIKYRPSLIEENPALLIWLLLLVAYLLVVVIAKYAWFIRDEQIVEATLWLLLIAMGMFIAVHQFLRAGKNDNLLSINDVIDNELILFVSLNINKNTAPVRALGKMMLQNLQLVVGKRYETETERKRRNKPLFSVVMDEFAPFGYRNFAQILNTARGTNTAFLFSLQSLPQLLEVGKGFQQDVSSAPGTTMLMQTRDEETAKYFKQASSQIPVQKRTQQLWRNDFLGFERYDKALGASEREQLEFRALDHHIKNLGKGKMEILMTDPIQGTLHGRLHVRPPSDVRVPLFEPTVLPKLDSSREDSEGANLRFKDQKLAAMVAFPRRR